MGDDHPEGDLHYQSSMDYWWPKLQDAGVRVPETHAIEVRDWDAAQEFHEGVPMGDVPMGEIRAAIEAVNGPPAFLRTDQASAKHRMDRASRVESVDDDELRDYVFELLNHNELAGFAGLPWTTIYVREWLDLCHRYTAFGGTPIAAEIRYFILDGKVEQWGFYWPEDAIKRPDTDDWQELHKQTRARATNAERRAFPKVQEVAYEFDSGYWSVDFALTAQNESLDNPNTWYCIDMARGEVSWHPEGCDKLATASE